MKFDTKFDTKFGMKVPTEKLLDAEKYPPFPSHLPALSHPPTQIRVKI